MSHDSSRKIRCLIAKVGLDGHDRGAHVIAQNLRDRGFEVIYSGLHRSPEEIGTATIQEDVDVLGISILSGAHNTLIPKVTEMLESYDALQDTIVVVGGIIPEEDYDLLKRNGVDSIFTPGESMDDIYEKIMHLIDSEDDEMDDRINCPSCGCFLKKLSDGSYKCTAEDKLFDGKQLELNVCN